MILKASNRLTQLLNEIYYVSIKMYQRSLMECVLWCKCIFLAKTGYLSVQLAGSDHDKHQQYKQRRQNFRINKVFLSLQLEAEKQFEEKDEQQLYEAPTGSESCGLVQSFQVLTNEHDNTKVGVESVTQEKRDES